MGIVVANAFFTDTAPSLDAIAAEVTALSGLPVTARHLALMESYDSHGKLAFDCGSKSELTLLVHRAGAAKRLFAETFGDYADRMPARAKNAFAGMTDPECGQTVHVTGYVGQEPTLMEFTLMALEALGGTLEHPMSQDQRLRCTAPLTRMQLRGREWKMSFILLPIVLLGVLLIPPYLVWIVFFDFNRKNLNADLARTRQIVATPGPPQQISRTDYFLLRTKMILFFVRLAARLLVWAVSVPFVFAAQSALYLFHKVKGGEQ